MIMDCKVTENYLREKARMCKDRNCCECPLGSNLNQPRISCKTLQDYYPTEAIAIVQKWSDEHPQKTYKDDFYDRFPDALKGADGTPKCCRKHIYGFEDKSCVGIQCYECWNEAMKVPE